MSDTNPSLAVPHLEILRLGSKGDLVWAVQNFLRGQDLYMGVIDEDFGPKTKQAVEDYQEKNGLGVDGTVGNMTWGKMMSQGLVLLPSDAHHEEMGGSNWPAVPAGMAPFTSAQRSSAFGSFEFEPKPVMGNPEGIWIKDRSPDFRIIEVELSLLRGVVGFAPNGKCFFHAKVALQLQNLIRAWEDAGLLGRVLGWGGSYAPRFVRGSRTTLSAHSWGTAFDINVPWNAMGAQPALVGRTGSVRELVPIANEHGFYWGGHFSRRDGMHFEVCQVMP